MGRSHLPAKSRVGKAKEPAVVLGFDLHGVLVRTNYGSILRSLISHPSALLCLFNLFFLIDLIWSCITEWGTMAVEGASYKICRRHWGTTKMAILVKEIANAQKVDTETFAVVKRLRAKGHRLYVFSNCGSGYFKELKRQLPNKLFIDFDGIYTSAPPDFVMKPYPIAFERFREALALDKEQVILIDNSKRNVRAADALSDKLFRGLHYTNAQQLVHDLKSLDLL